MTCPCPTCGTPSWNALLNPGQECLPCKSRSRELNAHGWNHHVANRHPECDGVRRHDHPDPGMGATVCLCEVSIPPGTGSDARG